MTAPNRQEWAEQPANMQFRAMRPMAGAHASRDPQASRIAIIVTGVLHALFVAYVLDGVASQTPRGADAAAEESVMQVIWIDERVPDQRPQLASSHLPAPMPAARRRAASPTIDAASTAAPPSDVVDDDAWSALPTRGPQDPFSVERSAPVGRSGRDLLARRETAFDRQATHMEDQMEDRSFGGWMRNASKRRDCAELRAALARAPESANTIIESMQRRGCKG